MKRQTLLYCALLAGVLTAITLWWSESQTVEIAENERRPAGRWSFQPPTASNKDLAARSLSLPYLAGTRDSTDGKTGVGVYDQQRAGDGVNLYVSGHASEAILIDMRGRVLHRWQIPFDEVFPNRPSNQDTWGWFIRRAHLLADGDLIVLWQGGGLARVDINGRIRWSLDLGVYNDLDYGEGDEPTIVTLSKSIDNRPTLRAEPVLNDHLVWIDPQSGEVQRTLSILDAISRSRWSSVLEDIPGHADILHCNTVSVLDAGQVAGTAFQPGNILFSAREIHFIGILDSTTEELVWGQQGPFRLQHEPVLLSGGNLLIFDNDGNVDGTSRALEISLVGAIEWSYPKINQPVLDSPEAGVVQRLTNGNTLIVESYAGRAIEVTSDQEVVWQFDTPHRAGPDQRLVASLLQLVRLPRPDWLPENQAN